MVMKQISLLIKLMTTRRSSNFAEITIYSTASPIKPKETKNFPISREKEINNSLALEPKLNTHSKSSNANGTTEKSDIED